MEKSEKEKTRKNRSPPRLAVPPNLEYRLHYPQVPVVVACRFAKTVAAMAVSSCFPVSSSSPATVAISIKKGLSTGIVLRKARRFSLNWLDYRHRGVIGKVSQTVPDKRKQGDRDKLSILGIPYRIVASAPVLEWSVAYAICDSRQIIGIGDHELFIATIAGAMASLDFDQYWKFRSYRPILYLGSGNRSRFGILTTVGKGKSTRDI